MGTFEDKLSQLEARLRQDLSWLELPAKSWVIERTHNGFPVLEVAIIGGGMAGLSAAGALQLMGVQALVFLAVRHGPAEDQRSYRSLFQTQYR